MTTFSLILAIMVAPFGMNQLQIPMTVNSVTNAKFPFDNFLMTSVRVIVFELSKAPRSFELEPGFSVLFDAIKEGDLYRRLFLYAYIKLTLGCRYVTYRLIVIHHVAPEVWVILETLQIVLLYLT